MGTWSMNDGARSGLRCSKMITSLQLRRLVVVDFAVSFIIHIGFSTDSEIVMVDLATTLSNKIGHGTTLGRPFQAFRVPTKIL